MISSHDRFSQIKSWVDTDLTSYQSNAIVALNKDNKILFVNEVAKKRFQISETQEAALRLGEKKFTLSIIKTGKIIDILLPGQQEICIKIFVADSVLLYKREKEELAAAYEPEEKAALPKDVNSLQSLSESPLEIAAALKQLNILIINNKTIASVYLNNQLVKLGAAPEKIEIKSMHDVTATLYSYFKKMDGLLFLHKEETSKNNGVQHCIFLPDDANTIKLVRKYEKLVQHRHPSKLKPILIVCQASDPLKSEALMKAGANVVVDKRAHIADTPFITALVKS
jgi:hypothetical protein